MSGSARTEQSSGFMSSVWRQKLTPIINVFCSVTKDSCPVTHTVKESVTGQDGTSSPLGTTTHFAPAGTKPRQVTALKHTTL